MSARNASSRQASPTSAASVSREIGLGEEKLVALVQESLSVATRTGAAKPSDFSKIIVDTTVQEKAIAFPTDAKLMHRARERLVRLAKKHGVALRQSYERIGKHALIAHQRYAHARQFKRANKALRKLRTFLGRVERDIARRIKNDEGLRDVFRRPLYLAERVREQRHKSAARRSIRCMRPRSNASARARRIAPTSSASRFRWRRRCTPRKAASS